jgi:cytochrome c peroxidase
MHDGSIQTLEEMIELYNKGGESNPFLDSGIRSLNLTDQEKADLLAFMKSLTSPQFANIVPSTRKE